jgi:hypothetical protein
VSNALRFVMTLATAVSLAPRAAAQDPLQLLPENYKLLLENEWVRVTRVHYPPQAKLPAHAHTTEASAYVYLNDGGPVVFRHIGLSYGEIMRPATTARAFRLFRGVQEVHEVENPNDTPSDFLRVELKQEPREAPLRGRYPPEDYPPDRNFAKVHFENERFRVSRQACALGQPCDLSAAPITPRLLVALTPARLKTGGGVESALEAGAAQWLGAGTARVVENTLKAPAEFLVFEFKTKPSTD